MSIYSYFGILEILLPHSINFHSLYCFQSCLALGLACLAAVSAQYHGGYGGHESHGGYAGLGGYGGHGGYSGGHGGYDDHSHVDYYVSTSLFSLKIIKLKIG